MKSVLPTLRKLIHLHPAVGVLGNVVEDACLALSCLSNGTVEQIQVVIDANICERLVILQRLVPVLLPSCLGSSNFLKIMFNFHENYVHL